jgi:hypothetical protein
MISKLTHEPHTALPWHTHPFPNALVFDGDAQKTRRQTEPNRNCIVSPR